MQLAYTEYVKLLVGAYKQRLREETLSPLLVSLSPSNIKQACLNLYAEQGADMLKRDERVLRDYFGVRVDGDIETSIKSYHLDNFKPIRNLIRKELKNPDLVNAELVAWLIDFRHRPYNPSMNVILNDEEWAMLNKKGVTIKESTQPEQPDRPGLEEEVLSTTETDNGKKKEEMVRWWQRIMPQAKNKLGLATAGLFVTTLGFGGIQLFRQLQDSGGEANLSSCMYWTDSCYAEIKCSEPLKDRLKLPMDPEKLKNFRMITKTDTITERSIGKVHYIKIDGRIEFYTAAGHHPVELNRSLHKLSAYMFAKYLKRDAVTKN